MMDDIPKLVNSIFKRYGKNTTALTPKITRTMQQYVWPGNVRELMAVMESYLVLLGANQACTDSFEEVFRHRNLLFANDHPCTLSESVAAHRRVIILKELERNGGNRQKAAKALGISYSSLRRILEKA